MQIDIEALRKAITTDKYYRSHLGEPQSDKYFCPFHPDKKTPNLIADEKGVHCFACGEGGDIFWFHAKLKGLPFNDVLKDLAEKYAPHLLSSNGNGHQKANRTDKSDEEQPAIEDARRAAKLNWLVKKKKESGYVPTGLYAYQCHESGVMCFRIRMDHPDPENNLKWITPFSFINGKWELKEPEYPHGKPLYIQEPDKSSRIFYIVEGEKKVDALGKLGLNAVTSGSSTSASKANWEKLQGHEGIIWPDHDEPGRKYAEAVAEILLASSCQVKQIDLEKLNLPVGGDICDWLDVNAKARKENVESLPSKSIIKKEENKIIQFPVPARGTGLNDFMKTAGILALSENSGPDEIIEAISKFSSITSNKDAVFLGIARSEVIKKLKAIGVQSPTKVVKDALKPQKSETVEGQGQTLSFEDPEPWLNEVDGLHLLDEISKTIRRYVILPEGAETALSLWVLFAWTHDAFQISPLLDFRSPLKRCGKSTGLKVVKRLVPKPLAATNVSTPSLFRGIEAFNPTLLIDEVDTFLNRDQETNGILNGGHERDGAFVLRCEGEKHEPRLFSVWCPKLLSGIGRRKDTLEDRSISIPMKRKAPGQKVEKLPINSGGEFLTLRRKMTRWSEDHIEELRGANPDIPGTLNDRAQDNWWPLFAIADLCGKEWSEKAREVALILSGDENPDDDTWGVQLLSDIREYFKEQNTDRVTSEDLVKHLLTLEDRDWSEMGRSGKEITQRGVSKTLKPFDVKPKPIRFDSEKTARGYTKEMLEDAFFHYLPDTPIPNVTSVTSLNNKELSDFQNVTNPLDVTDVKQPNLFKNNNVTSVTDKNGGMEEKNLSPSYENGWGQRHFDGEYGSSKAVWEKDGTQVPV
jgi:hypothetical protein